MAEARRSPFDAIARKWCDFAERRQAYYVELYRSGRWKHYYNEEQYALRLRDVIDAAKAFRAVVGPEAADAASDMRPAA